MSVWIYSDADNTLWDTDAVFAEAQLTLLEAAERIVEGSGPHSDRLAFVRRFDQAIAVRHHQGLRYPPVLLIRALGTGLRGSSAELAAQQAIAEGALATDAELNGLHEYAEILSRVPPILEGVLAGLSLAHDHRIPVYIISEGPLDVLRARLRAHELDSKIAGTLSARKSRDLYVRLRQRASPRRAVMIGDQIDRDIVFARDAGLQGVLIESRFRPHWTAEQDASIADAIVRDYLEAVQWVVDSDIASVG